MLWPILIAMVSTLMQVVFSAGAFRILGQLERFNKISPKTGDIVGFTWLFIVLSVINWGLIRYGTCVWGCG